MRISHYLGDHRALVTTVDGIKLYVDTRDLSLTPHLLVDGNWEDWVANQLRRRWVQRDWTVVEVGSNIGFYTTLLAQLVGAKGTVIGFEALPEYAALANASLDVNGLVNAYVEPLALSDAPGEVEFTRCLAHRGSSSFHRIDEIVPTEPTERVTVQVTTLDAYAQAHGVGGIDLLKIDAEGAEPAILRGAARLIDGYRINRILLEVNVPVLAATTQGMEPMLDRLRDQGFSLTEVHPDGLRPVTYEHLREAKVAEVYAERKG